LIKLYGNGKCSQTGYFPGCFKAVADKSIASTLIATPFHSGNLSLFTFQHGHRLDNVTTKQFALLTFKHFAQNIWRSKVDFKVKISKPTKYSLYNVVVVVHSDFVHMYS
jgi:hypothetical protein